MKLSSITHATDWFFVVFPVATVANSKLTVWPLAAWGLTEAGNVIGLVSVPGGGSNDEVQGEVCRLIPVPPLRGVYKHRSELTRDELAALTAPS